MKRLIPFTAALGMLVALGFASTALAQGTTAPAVQPVAPQALPVAPVQQPVQPLQPVQPAPYQQMAVPAAQPSAQAPAVPAPVYVSAPMALARAGGVFGFGFPRRVSAPMSVGWDAMRVAIAETPPRPSR